MINFLKKLFRPRNLFIIWGSLAVILFLYASDADASTGKLLVFIGTIATPVIAVLFSHVARKALFDYLDMGEFARKAKATATGAGLVFLGVCIVIAALLGLFGNKVYAQDVRTYIPEQAYTHLPTVKKEAVTHYSEHPKSISLLV